MAKQQERERAMARIRTTISNIDDQIERERDFIEFGASRDYEYQMSYARLDALRAERSKLQEIMGDLA